MRTFAIAAAVLTSLVAFTPVAAESVAKVSYADLDLSSRADVAKLDRRVSGAVEQVCGSYASATRDEEDSITGCRKLAMASYKAQLAEHAGSIRLASR